MYIIKCLIHVQTKFKPLRAEPKAFKLPLSILNLSYRFYNWTRTSKYHKHDKYYDEQVNRDI